jgi:acylpyruvate hydrolase
VKLATLRLSDRTTRAVRVDGDVHLDLGYADVGEVLRVHGASLEALRSLEASEDPQLGVQPRTYAPVVVAPSKIVCVGLNYRNHILEMGRELPQYPTLFAKYPEALLGSADDIALPPESDAVDWEAELAVVVGASVRRATETEAAKAIAGFAVLNDVTMRDWQYRTPMWLQGKTWESTTPFGPYLVTPDELPGGIRPALQMTGSVDGEIVQKADTSDLVFDPVALVQYISTILTLQPGDVIATGTPGGVGHARKPPRYLAPGQTLVTEIQGLGRTENRAVGEMPFQ